MTIQERYSIEETLNSFSLCPKKPSVNLSKWVLPGILVCGTGLFFFQKYIDKQMFWVIGVFLVYFFLHSLYDIQIGSKIRYTFDQQNNAVYKSSLFFSKRKILNLNEAVIFVHSEMGSWYYSLGAQKSQFVKNYRISENFSSSSKKDKRKKEYDEVILMKIDKLILSMQPS